MRKSSYKKILFAKDRLSIICLVLAQFLLIGTVNAQVNCNSFNFATVIVKPTCRTSCDGSITTTASGGSGNYSYLWNTGATTSAISQVCVAFYTVTVTDLTTQCVKVKTLSVTKPAVSASIINKPDYCESCNASITITGAAGGNGGPYTYLWSNGLTTSQLTGLCHSNTYTVTVFDNMGCSIQYIRKVGKAGDIVSDNNLCTSDACDPITGNPVYTPLPIPSDNNICTTDACDPKTGLPVYTPIPVPSDNNLCTTDACDPQTGLPVYTPIPVPGDNNLCTSDACDPQTGLPVYTPIPVPSDNNPCTTDACDPQTSLPVYTPIPVPGDNNLCTTDACDPKTGLPVYTPIPVPGDNNLCTSDACDPQTGLPVYTPIPVPSDNNVCTSDACDPLTGLPVYTTLPIEDDGNVCTTDGCDPLTGVYHTSSGPVCTITVNTPFQLCATPGMASYLWSNGATTECINVVLATTYTVTVANSNGCTSVCSKTISTPPSCGIIGCNIISPAVPANICATAMGVSYLWSNGATTQCISTPTPGLYTVTVTDANGLTSTCSQNQLYQICYESPTIPAVVSAKQSWIIDQNAQTVKIRTTFSKTFVDNTYGTGAIGWPGGHTFSNLTGSDNLELNLFDANNVKKMQVKIDYITADASAPSGFRSLGVTGGEGKVILGLASDVVSATTSLDVNLNTYNYFLTSNSPSTNANYAPNATYPNWIYDVWYEVTVKTSVFGAAGFGRPMIASVHASPSKTGSNTEVVVDKNCPPCEGLLKLGNLVWFDTNKNGLKEAGETGIGNVTVKLYNDANNDNIADGASIGTTVTNGSGVYGFSNLLPGNYIVGVVVRPGDTLVTINGGDPDNDIDNDNNGLVVTSGIAYSNAVTLAFGAEPINDGDNNDGNLAIDFGFYTSAPRNQICYVGMVHSYVTATQSWTYNVAVDQYTIRTTFSKNFVDNTYGTGAIGWPGGHTFGNLTGSDKLELALYDANNVKKMQLKIDYISSDASAPSGFKSLGVTGGEGKVDLGLASDVVSATTSLDVNLNTYNYFLTTNSPSTNASYAPNATYPNWIYDVWYEITVKGSAFGAAGFGKPVITSVHASPSKTGSNTEMVVEEECLPVVSLLNVGNLVWFDTNKNGLKEAGENGIGNVTVKLYNDANNDNIADGAAIGTTVTNGSGVYGFSSLVPGNYIVGVVVRPGDTLVTINGGDPDNDIDNDNNGLVVTSGIAYSNAVTLAFGAEPINDGDNNDGNLAIDFGFYTSVPRNQICYVGMVHSYVTATQSWTYNVAVDQYTIRTTFSKNFVDNTYGTGAIGWPGGHTFGNLTGSDKLELALYDANNVKKMQLKIDYISSDASAPSGFKSLGVTGGEGKVDLGLASDVVSATTSLDVNLNTYNYFLTTNSPSTNASYAPNATYPNWIYDVWYEITVKGSAFGAAGFGKPVITSVHASPSKTGSNTEMVKDTICVNSAPRITAHLINDANSFSLVAYPNPFSNGINLEFVTPLEGEATISISDITGRVVETLTKTSGKVIVGSNLKSGIYFINLSQGEFNEVIKVVKQD